MSMFVKQRGAIFTRRDMPPDHPSKPSHAASPTHEIDKLENLKDTSESPLLTIHTVFPFDLFPDTLTIDTTKVHIIIREFFFSAEIHSIPIKNITDIYVDSGPFFATLRILPQMIFQNQVTEVKTLWKSDAIKARDIIQGLIVATKENVDVTKLPQEEGVSELDKDLEEIGKAQGHYH